MNLLQMELQRAAAAFHSGNAGAAKRQASALAGSYPNVVSALSLAGMIFCATGETDRGAVLLKRALDRDPANKTVRFNLVRALADQGKFDEAERLCAGTGNDPDLLRLRAEIAKARGRVSDAIETYARVVAQRPDDYEAWNNLGNARRESGDIEGGIQALERAKELSSDNASVRLNLGRALVDAARYEEALAQLQQATALAPDDPAAHLELGRMLNKCGRSVEAIASLATSARLNPSGHEALMAIGLAFSDLGEFDRAEQAYQLALKASPADAQTYLNYGLMLEQGNRADELDGLIRQARDRGVQGDEMACLSAYSLRRQGRFAEAIAEIEGASAGILDEILRQHLVGQLADRLGDPDKAFSAFCAMNRAMRREPGAQRFDGTEHWRFVEGLSEMTTADWYSQWQPAPVLTQPPSPVFLVGFPRSGTTLLDTVLMGHPDTHVLEEEPMLGRVRDRVGNPRRLADLEEQEIADLRGLYFEELDKISAPAPGKLVIDKLPLNLLRTPLIHRLFPDAKFIFAARHPCDVVLSCFMQNFKINQAMASFLDLENAARLYDRAIGYWFQCQAVFPLQVHTVVYEAMVSDMESEVRSLLSFLELEWRSEVLGHQQTATDRGYIRTPSYAQVAEPIYARARGRWERYRPHLHDIFPILSPWAERLGYGPISDGEVGHGAGRGA